MNNIITGSTYYDTDSKNYFVYNGNDWTKLLKSDSQSFEIIKNQDYPYIKVMNSDWENDNIDEIIEWLAHDNGEYLSSLRLIRLNTDAILTMFILKFGGA